MPIAQAATPKAFCYEGKIIVIYKGEAEEVAFCKTRFLRTVAEILSTRKHFTSADVIVKEAIIKYTGTNGLAKTFKGKGITDDAGYMRLRNFVKEKFLDVFEKEQQERKKRSEIIRHNRDIEMMKKDVKTRCMERSGFVIGRL